MQIVLRLRRDNSFRQPAAVVLRHAVLPFQEIGNGLGFDADLNPAQAGQQQVHLPHQSDLCSLGLAVGLHGHGDFASFALQQTPGLGHFIFPDHSLRGKVEPLAAHADLRFLAEGLLPVRQKVGA